MELLCIIDFDWLTLADRVKETITVAVNEGSILLVAVRNPLRDSVIASELEVVTCRLSVLGTLKVSEAEIELVNLKLRVGDAKLV